MRNLQPPCPKCGSLRIQLLGVVADIQTTEAGPVVGDYTFTPDSRAKCLTCGREGSAYEFMGTVFDGEAWYDDAHGVWRVDEDGYEEAEEMGEAREAHETDEDSILPHESWRGTIVPVKYVITENGVKIVDIVAPFDQPDI